MVIAIIFFIFCIFIAVSNIKYDVDKGKERQKEQEALNEDKKRLEISLNGPYGEELSELLKEKNRLEFEKSKAVDSMAAVTNAAAMFQQKEKDWAVHGGIASGIGGPVIGGITAMNTIAENHQIRAQNEINRRAFQPAFNSASQSYGSILAQIADIDRKIAEIREKDKDRVLVEEKAYKGNAVAQYNMGVCYHKGEGVSQDYTEAAKWYRLAADQGYASAQCNLGNCYLNGYGVTKDYNKAVEYYILAARQGDKTAINILRILGESWS